ncbi:MAG: FAD:protein FMN transferase [Paludibacteraceae bacterium]|nr:FAD:protein FMN transferase [Paludibacteraceae bacterium]
MKKWIALGFAIIAASLLLLLPNTPKKQYYHHQGNIFGTYYNIRYESTTDLHHAIKQRLEEFDNSLSIFNHNSIISHINRNDSIATDSLFDAMYHEAYAISQLSKGAFDITVAPLVNAWGFGTKSQEPRTKNQDINIDSIKAFVGYQKVRLENHCLLKADNRITLDASAIAKGYACDVVADLLREKGCNNLLVDIGGEVVLQGVNEKGKAWRVGITRPTIDAKGAEKELQEIIESNQLYMATSGNYLQYYFANGQRRSHTIDPRTGYPVEHTLLSATVSANSCMRSDALATACMVLGEQGAIEMIEQTEDAACYLIVADNDTLRIVTSQRWSF